MEKCNAAPTAGVIFFSAHFFSCRVLKSRVRRRGPRYAGKPRRLGPAKSARERMARGQGGVAGVGGVEAHGAEVALIATARCTAQARSAHQRRCHPEHMARRTRDGVRRDRAVSKMRMREKESRLHRPPVSAPRTRRRCGSTRRNSG